MEDKTIWSLAREARASADSDDAARTLLTEWTADGDMHEAVYRYGVAQLIANARNGERRLILAHGTGKAQAARSANPDASAPYLKAAAEARGLFDMPLPYITERTYGREVALGDATVDDLQATLDAIEHHMNADTVNKLWLGMVIKRVKPGKSVRQCVKLTELKELRVAAETVVYRDGPDAKAA